MARPCKACASPRAPEIARRLKAGETAISVSRWLTDAGSPIGPHALGRHRDHIGVPATHGRVGPSDDFLESVRDAVHERVQSGELQPGVRDGIAAQKALDAREAKEKDRDWQLRLVMALTGNVPQRPRLVDHWDREKEAGEAEILALTTGAD
jgi:hypothetical protein